MFGFTFNKQELKQDLSKVGNYASLGLTILKGSCVAAKQVAIVAKNEFNKQYK